MLIKTDRRIIDGEHLGVPFRYEAGYLLINGQTYSKAEIKALVNIGNLLELEGFKLADSKPIERKMNYKNWLRSDWAGPNNEIEEE